MIYMGFVDLFCRSIEILGLGYANLFFFFGLLFIYLLDYLVPHVILSKESLAGKGPGYAFAEVGVETMKTEAGSLEELVEDLLAGLEDGPAN